MPAPSVSELRRTLNRQVLKAHAAKVIAVFQSWELDGDGAISKREFRRAVQPLLNLPAGPEALDELFDLFDNDGSGCVGLKQIHEVLRRGPPLGPPPELLQPRVAAPRESRAQVRPQT
jgi:Ca2+-binding EF-hand superfamily protein